MNLKKKSNSDIYFDNSQATANLKQRTIRGGILTLLSQAFKFILQIGSTVFLARLLTPEDYGLIGMVTVALNFLNLFKDIGLSQATIQKAEINQAQVSNLFWVNVFISFLVALLLFLLAPVIVWFYQEPRLLMITKVLAISFFVSGLSLQHLALLKRQMLFGKIIAVEMTSQFFGLVVGIISAIYGLGYWSLVIMQVTQPIIRFVGIWLNCHWIPSLPSRNTGVKDMLNYGWNLTGFNVLNFFSRNLDNILIGKYWGTDALGLYAKAYQLLLLPIQQINAPVANIALPALSRLQLEPERYQRVYYQMILFTTTLGMPIVIFSLVDTEKIILLLLGEKWIGMVPIFRALAPPAYLGTFNIAFGLVFNSLNKTLFQLKWGIFSSLCYSLSFLISVRYGVMALAITYSVVFSMLVFLLIFIGFQDTPIKATTFLKTISKPIMASISSGLVLFLLNNWKLWTNKLIFNLIIDLFIYTSTYLLIWFIIPNGKSTLKSMIKNLKSY